MSEEMPLFLKIMDLAHLLRVGRWTIFQWLRQGRLPQPQRVTARCIRWHRDDLAEILRYGPMPAGHFNAPNPLDLATAVRRANTEVTAILEDHAPPPEAEPLTPPAKTAKRGRPKKPAAATSKPKAEPAKKRKPK